MIPKHLIRFVEGTYPWEAAIRESSQTLLAHGYIDAGYVEAMIGAIHKHGPYIVIMPGIAMPHALEGAKGVLKTGMALTKFSKDIIFSKEEDLKASVFITVASRDPKTHLANISWLGSLLSNLDCVALLRSAQDKNALIEVVERGCDDDSKSTT